MDKSINHILLEINYILIKRYSIEMLFGWHLQVSRFCAGRQSSPIDLNIARHDHHYYVIPVNIYSQSY